MTCRRASDLPLSCGESDDDAEFRGPGLGAAQEGSAGHAEPAVGVENGGLGPRGAGTGGSGGGGLTPGPQVPVNSQSRENPWTTVISVIALLVSFYGLYQSQQANGLSNEANQLSAKANDLAAASNRASADALKIANDGATASVSVAEARRAGLNRSLRRLRLTWR